MRAFPLACVDLGKRFLAGSFLFVMHGSEALRFGGGGDLLLIDLLLAGCTSAGLVELVPGVRFSAGEAIDWEELILFIGQETHLLWFRVHIEFFGDMVIPL